MLLLFRKKYDIIENANVQCFQLHDELTVIFIIRFKKEVEKMELILGIILLVMAVALVVLVLFQQGKDKNLSGTIAGGAETFFGKSKGTDMNKTLTIATSVVAVLFTALVLVMYLVL